MAAQKETKKITVKTAKAAAKTKTAAKPVAKKTVKTTKGASKPVKKVVAKSVKKVVTKKAQSKKDEKAFEELIKKPARSSPAKKGGKILTEREILAMPKKDYMNAAQVAFFKNRLEMMQEQLRTNADQTTENLREVNVVPDPVDRATLEEERAFELRTRDRERKLLKKVQAALRRIEDGEYGWCEETGEPIGLERLMARPTTTLSLEAQQRRELRQKMYGD